VKAADNAEGFEFLHHPTQTGKLKETQVVCESVLYWMLRLCREEYGPKEFYITENDLSVEDTPETDGTVPDWDRILAGSSQRSSSARRFLRR
jgi:beta-glucosidase/6-phospho-beta-glucosidase/beta-galactosidase